MPVSRAGPLLAKTRLDEFRPLGSLGEPAYLAYPRLVAALEALGAEDCARYFARPEPDGRGETLSWHAPDDGPARLWTSLSEEEQRETAPRLLAIKEQLSQLCSVREAVAATDGIARLLRSAAVSPGLEHLYVVGERPVLTAWGFDREHGRFDTLSFALPPAEPEPRTPPTPVQAAAAPWLWLWPWPSWWWPALALPLLLLVLWFLWALIPARELIATPDPTSRPTTVAAAPEATEASPPREPMLVHPARPAPKPGEQLVLPERGVEFLEGTWRTDSGLVDRSDGKPLVQTFTFDRRGWGEVVTRRSDGVTCRARARAERTADGGLIIYGVELAACSNGDSYVRFRLECAPGVRGASECRGVNGDDGSRYGAVVRRL
jgi:hypothetical protein